MGEKAFYGKSAGVFQRKWLRRLLILAAWLAVWQLLSLWIGNSILMVGPVTAGKVFLKYLPEIVFWKTVLFSLLRIGAGFLAGLLLGLLLAVGSCRFSLLEEILEPVIMLLKSIPVASFVVLLLMWWGSSFLSAAISFLIVLPTIYINTLEGLKSTNRSLLEMAEVFRMPLWNRFFYIYRPALKPFMDSSLKISLGMSWKSGVAAEVIGTPDYSIGEKLYMSKIHLDTAGVLAWTVVIILVSFLFEKLILIIWDRFVRWEPVCRLPLYRVSAKQVSNRRHMAFYKVSKSYGEQPVLQEKTTEYGRGGIYFFTSPSGSGKTTAFRLLAGLEVQDSGEVVRYRNLSMVFQEDRLCEGFSALRNVEMVTGSAVAAAGHLRRLLPEEELTKPCCQLSGGMKRRVAVVRAMAAQSEAVLLDEPLTGLDEANRRKTIHYILQEQKGRTLLIATHSPEDMEEKHSMEEFGGTRWKKE